MKRYISVLLIFALSFSLVGCSVDAEELGDVVIDIVEDKTNEFIDNSIEGVKEKTSNLWEIYVVDPLSDAWDSITSLFALKSKITEDNGKYYLDGQEITDVTLDVIAQAEYKKDFNACNVNKRKEVIRLFAIYNGVDTVLVDFIEQLEEENSSIDWDNWDSLEKLEDIMILGSADFALMHLYAEAPKNKNVEEFLNGLSTTAKIGEVVYKVTKTIFLVLNLTNNNISDPEEYCVEFIKALEGITSFMPSVSSSYFSAGLTVVEEGVKIVIEQYGQHQRMLGAYTASTDRNASGILTADKWLIVAQPDKWDYIETSGLHSLSLEEIASQSNRFAEISDAEREYIEDYIVFRIKYELSQIG